MKIIVQDFWADDFLKSLREKIKNKEIQTWKVVKDGGYDRLLHTGDDQYDDVVLRILGPSDAEKKEGLVYTEFIPKIRDGVKGRDAIETATSHFGIVLGRFAEVLNCHYPEIKEYKTVL